MAVDFKKSISDPIAVDVGNYVTQGRIVSKTIQLASFTNNENAVWAAKRQLQKGSYPFAFISVTVNRNLFRLQVGDCFKFSYSKYGISNMICRVLQVQEENLESEKIVIHAVEDIFGISNTITEYSDPTGHAQQAASYSLTPFTHQKVVEALYVFSEDIKVIPLACREEDLDLGFDVHLSIDGGASYLSIGRIPDLKPYGTLVGSYPVDTYTIDEDVGFTIDFVKGVSLIETTTWSSVFTAQVNNAVLGNEVISFKSITPVAGSQYKLEGIIRGRFGTQKVVHAADEEFWFLGESLNSVEHAEIIGSDRKFKLVPYNIKNTGDISESTPIDLTIEGLAKKPYVPINFMANGSSFAARYSYFRDVTLTWSPRYRGKGAGIGIPGIVLADVDREGYFRIEVWIYGVKVRETAGGLDTTTWVYLREMAMEDNAGTLPSEITFKLLNWRIEDGVLYESDQIEISCKEGESSIASFPGAAWNVQQLDWQRAGFSWAEARCTAVAAAVAAENSFYVGLGHNIRYVAFSDWWAFDCACAVWVQKGDFPGGARAEGVAVECGGKIYVGTGYDETFHKDCELDISGRKADWWEYDPTTDTWTQKADFGGGKRTKAMAAEVGGKIYVGMGLGEAGGISTFEKDWWEYDPGTDTWVQKADFSTDRIEAVTIGSGGKIYFGLGIIDPEIRQRDWWEYNPATNIWTQKGDFSTYAKSNAVIAEEAGKIYVGLGIDTPLANPEAEWPEKDWWEYTPATDTWVQKTDFGYWLWDARIDACAAAVNGKIYVGLGKWVSVWGPTYKREWRVYDIATDTWLTKTFFGDPNFVPRSFLVGASVGDKIYVGTGAGTHLNYVKVKKDWWEYDSITKKWCQKADFGGAARSNAVAVACGGKIYLGLDSHRKDWWEYNPTTDVWVQKGDFPGSERYNAVAMAVEATGKIYVGFGHKYDALADWYEYDVVTEVWVSKSGFIDMENFPFAAELNGRIFVGANTVWREYSYETDSWADRADFLGTFSRHRKAIAVGDSIFVANLYKGEFAEWWEYLLEEDSWIRCVDFPGGKRKGEVVIALGSEGYIGAGYGEKGDLSGWELKNDWWKFKKLE